jgi:hypothetical protein
MPAGIVPSALLTQEPKSSRLANRIERSNLARSPDPHTTNIAFGDKDMRTACITFSQGGAIARCNWSGAGLHPPFNL